MATSSLIDSHYVFAIIAFVSRVTVIVLFVPAVDPLNPEAIIDLFSGGVRLGTRGKTTIFNYHDGLPVVGF